MSKFKWDNLVLFVEQLATASALKLPLDKAIRAMSQEALDRRWRQAQVTLSELVALGTPLHEAMENYPQFFPALLRRVVRVGEEGRVLPTVLTSLSRYLQFTQEIRHRLQKCMVYPFLVWTVLLFDLTILFTFVVPKFDQMITQTSGVHYSMLNTTTVPVMFFILVNAVLFFLVWIVSGWIGSEAESGKDAKSWMERITAFLPFLGTLQHHAKAAEVCELMGILIEEGHPGREAVNLAKSAVTSPVLLGALEEVETAMVSGQSYNVGAQRTLIPQSTLWMLSEVAEIQELGRSLRHLAEYHRRQIDILTGFIREILEPLLLFAVAVLGGWIIVMFYSSSLFKISALF